MQNSRCDFSQGTRSFSYNRCSEHSPEDAGYGTATALAVLLLSALLFLVTLEQFQPRRAEPANAPPGQFSAYRAMDKLRVIAREPHPVGSEANARVRQYLISELAALQLNPQVQSTTVARTEPKWFNRIVGASIVNVTARLPGTANTRPVMLVAHYDSVPGGPGASDDGSGVVTLLETARALRSSPALHNDLIFLFTDAEEEGLLGAQAFVREHPWAHEPGLVLNVEARGACGPSMMFETSSGNGWLIHELAASGAHPVTSSLFYEAYKRLPNDTDLTIFKWARLPGLNFAYVGCFPRYHTREDSPANLDPGSIQQEGSYILTLVRRFGNLELTHATAPDAIFFNVWHWLVRYPSSWTVSIFELALALFALVFAAGLRRGRLRLAAVLAGLAGWMLATGAAIVVSHLVWGLLRPTRFVALLPYGMAYNGGAFAWALAALTVAIVSAVFMLLFRRFDAESVAVGTLAWWLLSSMALVFVAPAASYLLLWPLLAGLVPLVYAATHDPASRDRIGPILWTVPIIVVILVVGGLPYLLIMLLGTVQLTPLVAAVSLLIGFLMPFFRILGVCRRWWLTESAALACLGLIATGMATAGYSANRPRADSLFYALDADKKAAVWASFDTSVDNWTGQFLKGPVERDNLRRTGIGPRAILTSVAPAADLAGPSLTTVQDTVQGGTRRLAFELHFDTKPSLVWIAVKDARVFSTSIGGKAVTVGGAEDPKSAAGQSRAQGLIIFYSAPPADGLRVELQIEKNSMPSIQVSEDSAALPAIPGFTFNPRPPEIMPTQWWPPLDSSTVVTRTFNHFSTMEK